MAIIRSEVVEPGDLATGRPPILEFRTDDGRAPYFAVPGTPRRMSRDEARARARASPGSVGRPPRRGWTR